MLVDVGVVDVDNEEEENDGDEKRVVMRALVGHQGNRLSP